MKATTSLHCKLVGITHKPVLSAQRVGNVVEVPTNLGKLPNEGEQKRRNPILQRQNLTSDIPVNRAAGWVLIRPRVLGVLPGASEYRAHRKQLLVAIYSPFIKSLSVIGVTMRCALHHRSCDKRLLQFHSWVEKKTSWGRLQWTRKGTGGSHARNNSRRLRPPVNRALFNFCGLRLCPQHRRPWEEV